MNKTVQIGGVVIVSLMHLLMGGRFGETAFRIANNQTIDRAKIIPLMLISAGILVAMNLGLVWKDFSQKRPRLFLMIFVLTSATPFGIGLWLGANNLW